MNSEGEGVIEQLLRTVRRRKWIVLQATIVVPVLALVFSLSQEDEYTATATLLFRQAPSGITEGTESVIDPTREAATNGQLVGLPVVAEKAAESLDGVSGAEVLEDVSVEPSSEADTAKIVATTTSAELSAEMANAYGRAYIDFRRNADRSQVQDAIDVAEASLEQLSPAEREGKEGEALGEQLDHLKLSQALQTGGAELVQPATPPSDRSSPQPMRNVALGLVLGVLLGLGLAVLLERIDRRVRTVEELEELYEVPILARIPRSQRLGRKQADAISPQTPEGEAFRVLRTNLRYFNVDKGMRSLLIISPEAGDGKSTVAKTLATTMAEMGDDVVLVEGDLRKGGDLLDVTGSPASGLSNVLTGTPYEKVLIETEVPGPGGPGGLLSRTLTVLPSGPVPPNPSELLESAQMRDLLIKLQERFQIVVIDSPALAAVSDALALVSEVSTVVIVGGLGRTTRDAGRELGKQFALLGKKPIGVVANFTEPERGKYSHYYHSELAGSTSST